MKRFASAFRILFVLWAGSLWGLIWVTMTLFNAQPDRSLAGLIAGHLFTIETYVGLAAAGSAVLMPARRRFLLGYVAAGVLALNEWGLRPIMAEARSQGTHWGLSFGAWHGVSALLYVIACVAVLALVWNDDLR